MVNLFQYKLIYFIMMTDGKLYRVDFIDRETPLYVCSSTIEHVLWLVDKYILKTGQDTLQISRISLLNSCIF